MTISGRDIGFSSFECTAGNGLRVRGSFHATHRENAPCVLFCHGFTGHRLGPSYLFVRISRALAETGTASARFDFRGAGESEGLFSEMNTGTMMEDCATVAEHIRSLYRPSRLILCGHSFGGMIAARSAAALGAELLILLSPVGEPQRSVRRRQDLLDTGPNATGLYENGPHEMSISFLDHLLGFDPVEELTASYTGKLLLFQGDADPSIPVDESYRYVDCARKAGIPAGYHLLTGCDHNYSRVADVTTVTGTIISWIKEHCGE